MREVKSFIYKRMKNCGNEHRLDFCSTFLSQSIITTAASTALDEKFLLSCLTKNKFSEKGNDNDEMLYVYG